MARLVAVNVGLPRDIAWRGKTVRTGIYKSPVAGHVLTRRLNIDGDGQGDLGGHGGLNRPVMVYQLDSYRYWERELSRNNLTYGQFGENFTVDGLADAEVFIGDRYRIGSALFEISQPRVTCYRVGIRMDDPQMAAKLVAHHRPGFYFRVLQEGEVGAGDEVVKVADGPERMSVADVDAMLYLRGHTHEQLQVALRIPALSDGWKDSFRALLQEETNGTVTGNAGLAPESAPPPAWPGFRPLQVSRIVRESSTVISLVFVPSDNRPLNAPLPGQFVVLRVHPKADGPALIRNYSLSDLPTTDHYRISIKQEVDGIASTFLHTHIRVGDVVEVAAPRGSFTLRAADKQVVLLSAGVGATPVLAMLHALANENSQQAVWWLFGAPNRDDHPFAAESGKLINTLPNAKSHIRYSHPGPQDRQGIDFDEPGRLSADVCANLGVPRDADFYLCGPPAFMQDLTTGLAAWGVPGSQVHAEIFGARPSITPGIADAPRSRPHPPVGPAGPGPRVSFARSALEVCWDSKFSSLLDFAEACDVPVRWSCRTGVCHTCETALISGRVNYEPQPLDAPAEGNVLICCSQPQGNLVLDL